jgi:hypothetical protein
LLNKDFEGLQFGPTEGGALSVSSDEQSRKEERCDTFARRVDASYGSWDDHDFEPLQDTSVKTEECPDVCVSMVEQTPAAENPEDENIWLKVGGGLAVFGAVVGGVALLAARNGGDDDRERRRENGKSN